MKDFKSHFKFNKQERSGIFFLILFIAVLQVVYFLIKWNSPSLSPNFELNVQEQHKIDSLKQVLIKEDASKVYPFNPNFISDYKGYTLGMSPKEIDRLHKFRAKNMFVNSSEEFQLVTQISDSLLGEISPYFKFPDWVSQEKRKKVSIDKKPLKSDIQDLNKVTVDDLKKINGIGEKLSARIVKFRDRLGGFIVNEQLYDVYGLEPEVVNRALQRYQVIVPPKINKTNINRATASEIASLVYINYDLANKIVEKRQLDGAFSSFDELESIEGFPKEKIERIKLYLSL